MRREGVVLVGPVARTTLAAGHAAGGVHVMRGSIGQVDQQLAVLVFAVVNRDLRDEDRDEGRTRGQREERELQLELLAERCRIGGIVAMSSHGASRMPPVLHPGSPESGIVDGAIGTQANPRR